VWETYVPLVSRYNHTVVHRRLKYDSVTARGSVDENKGYTPQDVNVWETYVPWVSRYNHTVYYRPLK
jgi:hypothetical protein